MVVCIAGKTNFVHFRALPCDEARAIMKYVKQVGTKNVIDDDSVACRHG